MRSRWTKSSKCAPPLLVARGADHGAAPVEHRLAQRELGGLPRDVAREMEVAQGEPPAALLEQLAARRPPFGGGDVRADDVPVGVEHDAHLMRPSTASFQRSISLLKMASALWEPASISLSDSAQAASTER